MRRFLVTGLLCAGVMLAANAKVDQAKAKVKEGKYDEAITVLETEHKAQPKNAEVKSALAQTHLSYGDSLMNNAQMPPFRKYPGALKQFRSVLQYEPDNKKAKDNIALIEGIYKSMGREVPK
jgi:tetratricopeptide (TPR) repeat protein